MTAVLTVAQWVGNAAAAAGWTAFVTAIAITAHHQTKDNRHER